jgi:triacylglycerol esterase/lipase EstA (alpha/beta hydrolase family)
MNRYFNQKLKQAVYKNPVIFTFHLNWKIYENFGLSSYNHIIANFKANNINVELLPILTDKRTDIESRIKQVKRGIEKIVDKYERKATVISYSLSGIDTRGYISSLNGDQNINTLLTISTPHK